ncbi:MAG: BNR-4 repeat-containing protein [Deltaproteobacteria bacterium]|nr:BNR-4 repeat-containing protein [Deltaproteobacteria bacterium]
MLRKNLLIATILGVLLAPLPAAAGTIDGEELPIVIEKYDSPFLAVENMILEDYEYYKEQHPWGDWAVDWMRFHQQANFPQHERERFDWAPDFDLNIPTFDSENRAYVRGRAPVNELPPLQVLTPSGWEKRDFDRAALAPLFPGAKKIKAQRTDGDISTKVVFDRQDDAYAVSEVVVKYYDRIETRFVLFHSRDRGQTWTPYKLPVSGQAIAFEHPWSPENLEGPPAIVVWQYVDNIGIHDPEEKSLGNFGKLWLITPSKSDEGTLSLGSPRLLTDRATGFGSHSGAPSVVATWRGRTYVVWAETPPASLYEWLWGLGTDLRTMPNYINVLDRRSGELGSKQPLASALPADDSHNVPGLVIDSRGIIHVITGTHGGNLKYQHSKEPESIDRHSWTEPQPTSTGLTGGLGNRDCGNNTPGWPGGCQTYLSFMRDSNDTLHIAYRQWQDDPSRHGGAYFGALVHQRKPANGPWGDENTLVVPSIPLYFIYYHKMSIDKDDRLYLLYHHYSKYTPYGGMEEPRSVSAMLVSDDTQSWRLVSSGEMAAAATWEPESTLMGDTDGDGTAEVVSVYRRPRLKVLTESSGPDGDWTTRLDTLTDGPGVHQYPTLMGDVDGDNRDDLVFVFRDSRDGWLTIRTKLSNGDGTWSEAAQVKLGDGPGVHQYPTLLGDVNGDDRHDLVFVFRHWRDGRLTIRTKLSNGDGTWSEVAQVKLGDGPGVHQYPTLLGDVNGDGWDDLVFAFRHWADGSRRLRTKLSTGDGSFEDQ